MAAQIKTSVANLLMKVKGKSRRVQQLMVVNSIQRHELT